MAHHQTLGVMKAVAFLASIFILSVLCSCLGPPLAPKIRQDLQASLKVGDPRTRIEYVLKAHGYEFNYDKDLKRYESGVSMKSAEKNRHGVYIEIYVDDNWCLTKIDVNDWYTGL